MLKDEAVGQNHGQVEDAADGRQARAVGHELLGLAAHGHVQLGHLYRHALALQHLDRLQLLARPQAPAVAGSSPHVSTAQFPASQGVGSIRTEGKDWAASVDRKQL